jgi:hypothetical protein
MALKLFLQTFDLILASFCDFPDALEYAVRERLRAGDEPQVVQPAGKTRYL